MYLNVASPISLSILPQGAQITLLWAGGIPPYQVQTAASLSSPAWSNIGGPLSTNTLTLAPSNAASFYRVQGQ